MRRRNFVAMAFGRRGSGKSYLLRRFATKFPRRLSLDPMGEAAESSPRAIICYTVDDVRAALAAQVHRQAWHIVACIDPADAPSICRMLAPPNRLPQHSYSSSVGGVCLEAPEVDVIAPNSGAIAPEVRNVFQRGRHYGLSILGDSQRPHLVNRVTSSQADVIIAFQQHEPRDIKYLGVLMSEPLAALVPALERVGPYTHLRYFPATGIGEIVLADGRVWKRLRADGISDLPLFSGSAR